MLGPNLVISVAIGGMAWPTLLRYGSNIARLPSPLKWFALVATLGWPSPPRASAGFRHPGGGRDLSVARPLG